MKLSPTQADVLRRLDRGDRCRWAACGVFWAEEGPRTPRASLTTLRRHGMITTIAFAMSRVVRLTDAGRAWVKANPENAG